MIEAADENGSEFQAFTIDEDGMLWNEEENGDVKDITKITIYSKEQDGAGASADYGFDGNIVTYDAIAKKFTHKRYGDEFYCEEGGAGYFDIDCDAEVEQSLLGEEALDAFNAAHLYDDDWDEYNHVYGCF